MMPGKGTGLVLAFAATLLAAPACAQFGGALLDPAVGGRPNRSVLDGEVRSVDARNGRIQLRANQGGTVTLRYDDQTEVFYERRRYPATALERGDLVRVLVGYDRSGTAWADRVDVVRDVRETARVQRMDGAVVRVDTRRSFFTLQQGRAAPVTVFVPSHLQRDVLRRFERLRSGDRVRVDVVPLRSGGAELVRFR